MVRWARLGAVLTIGCAGAVLWAYAIAVWEPLCETGALMPCWAPEVRWSVILVVSAAVAALVRRWRVAGLAALWLVADLALDRIDLGAPGLWPAAIFAGGLVTAAAVLLQPADPLLPQPADPGSPAALPAEPVGSSTG